MTSPPVLITRHIAPPGLSHSHKTSPNASRSCDLINLRTWHIMQTSIDDAAQTPPTLADLDARGLALALREAERGRAEGGIPIGCALLARSGARLGAGHNQRVQRGSPTLHAEIAALEDAGRRPAAAYRDCTLYTTLSPCSMCSGAVLLYGIPRVVVGEHATFVGEEALLRSRGVEVVVRDDVRCVELLRGFIEEHPEIWYEDIGKPTEGQALRSAR
ncbi:cytidine deaminase-like protein [Gloeopeniophorella convolvens]|nr:cytidine deaminase-like protein [Gloeopeniophorella convolvens]